LPLTVALPTVVPPVEQLLGAVACGPKTLNVIVPVAAPVAPLNDELIAPAAIWAVAAELAGPPAAVVVVFLTTVEAMPGPHVLADAPS
jgi:hypothetical protein